LGNLVDGVSYRDLTTLDEFAQVVALERLIWGPGYDEVVPVPILAVSVHRGGILIGAFHRDRLIAFVYSLPGLKAGQPTQWSHMAGVVAEYRNAGLGRVLKGQQRDRALAMGLDLIEWTYDPLQAMNAHLNFAKLGVVCEEYAVNLYGESSSPLHRGNPTDRFVVEWWIRKPHVERRLNPSSPMTLRSHEVGGAPAVNGTCASGEWLECADVDLSVDARRLTVQIPMGFTEMLSGAPELALRWRMATREIFTSYFARGYKAVEFFLDRDAGKGAYLLTKKVEILTS
jgi:predicted GNAT superfamily acetyltransferase